MHDNPILVSPTGTGKTVTAVGLIDAIGGRVLWIAHRRELIDQAVRHLRRYRPADQVGVMYGGTREHPRAPIQVGSVQTLRAKTLPPADAIIIDEAHHATSATYKAFFQTGRPVVGLTATPYRLDGKPLGDLFKRIIVAITEAEAVKQGFLTDADVYACDRPNLSEIGTTGGDFNQAELGRAMNQPRLVGDLLNNWKKRAVGRKTIIYASSIVHSIAIRDLFRDAGVRIAHLDGQTQPDERADILNDLREGRLEAVTNVDILTEGYDLPTLEAVIIARPTKSLCLHRQIIGRAVRAAAGKGNAIILDHAGNHHRHGRFTRPLEYSLEGRVRTAKTVEPLGMRTCGNCFRLYEPNRRECPICGAIPEPRDRREIRHDGGDLIEFDDSDFEYRRDVWESIKTQADAAQVFRKRFGITPATIAGRLIDADESDKYQKKRFWEENSLKHGTDYADKVYMEIFGVKPYWQTEYFKRWETNRKRRWKRHA